MQPRPYRLRVARAPRPGLFDPSDVPRTRLVRARSLAVFGAFGVVPSTILALGGAPGVAPQPRALVLVALQVAALLVSWTRGARVGDREFVALQVALLATGVPLLMLSVAPGSSHSAELVLLVPIVLAAAYCGSRLQTAVVVGAAVAGATLISRYRIVDPAEAASQVAGQLLTFVVLAGVVRLLRDSAYRALILARLGEVTDPLTGVLNRRGFERSGAVAWARAAQEVRPMAVLAIDLDHFKAVNDSLGHAAGDKVLQRVGSVLRASLRAEDVAARLGGEEFAVLCSARVGEAGLLAERIKDELTRAIAPVTVSVGAVEVLPAVGDAYPGDELWRAVETADSCLYEAKSAGRDRVVSRAQGGSQR